MCLNILEIILTKISLYTFSCFSLFLESLHPILHMDNIAFPDSTLPLYHSVIYGRSVTHRKKKEFNMVDKVLQFINSNYASSLACNLIVRFFSSITFKLYSIQWCFLWTLEGSTSVNICINSYFPEWIFSLKKAAPGKRHVSPSMSRPQKKPCCLLWKDRNTKKSRRFVYLFSYLVLRLGLSM